MKKLLLLSLILILGRDGFAQCYCQTPFFSETYDSLSAWTNITQTTGNMTVSMNQLYYNSPIGGNYNRISRYVPDLHNYSTSFTARCKFRVTQGNSPGHYIMAFTSTDDDPLCMNTGGYPQTSNSVIGVSLLSPVTPTYNYCCTNPVDPADPWGFKLILKEDLVLNSALLNQYIPFTSFNTDYYVQLQRSADLVTLSVFSDAQFTQMLPGSPICERVSETFPKLNYVQQGVHTAASYYREIDAYLDDLTLCGGVTCQLCGPDQITENPGPNISIAYNTSLGSIVLGNSSRNKSDFNISIYTTSGQLLLNQKYLIDESLQIPFSPPAGIYFISIKSNSGIQMRTLNVLQ